MRFALLALFVLVWWPFHRKPAPSTGIDTPIGRIHLKDSDCAHTTDGYFFVGPDGIVGYSKESCDDAFNDWNTDTGSFPTVWKI